MSELARPVPLDRIGPQGTEIIVEAGPAECAALTARLMIPAVSRLRCAFRLRRTSGSVIHADGDLEADVVQSCVVTLDDVPQQVRERFTVLFVPAGSETEDDDPESPDQIPYGGNAIDLGEAAAEQLALALDPYPRSPGAPTLDDDPETRPNPFAVLRRPQ